MTEALLTFHTSEVDGETVAGALREATGRPVHLRGETVYGIDFSDASTAERVTGRLDRCAIELIVDQDAVEVLVAKVGATKRVRPVRWHAIPLLGRGRLA